MSDMSISGKMDVSADFNVQAEELTNASPSILQKFEQGLSQIGSDIVQIGKDVGKAAGDVGQLLQPGNLGQPNQANAPAGGFAPGGADGPSDTGNVGQNDPTQGTDGTDGTDPTQAGGGDDLSQIMKLPFPGNILALLAKMADKAQGDVEKAGKKLANDTDAASGKEDGHTKAISQTDTQNLQQASSNLSDLKNLLSTLTKDMHEINASIIRNT